jgi:phosphinothricin acetyltransferase
VYVATQAKGRGIGQRLLQELIALSESDGFWTLQAHIMVANTASRALHRRAGFREVGIRERLGQLGGVWHDVVLFERRSTLTGGPGLPTRKCGAR